MFEYLVIPLVTSAITLGGMLLLLKKFGRDVSEALQNVFTTLSGENVKRAMTIIGKQGGDTKAQNAIKSRVAKAFINKNYGVYKIAAEKLIGLDVDELIEDYGAENIISALKDFLPSLGIDITKGLPLGLNKSSDDNEGIGVIP